MMNLRAIVLFITILCIFSMPLSCTAAEGDQNGVSIPLKFDNPDQAYEILKQLDVFESIEPEDAGSSKYKKDFYGLKTNPTYCEEHRRFFVNNPQEVFEKKNFISDFWDSRPRRITVAELGKDLHPDVGFDFENEANSIDMNVEATAFFTTKKMCTFRKIGIHFSCLTQQSNKVRDNKDLYYKDRFTYAMMEYQQNYETRPQCLTKDQFFPRAWVMNNVTHCKDFFNEFNSPQYFELKRERRIVYMRKIAAHVHMAEGIYVVDEKEEATIRELFDNGTKCGEVQDNSIMQYLIPNPLLLENRKFDFRIFLFIASTNPVIAYYYDGNLKVSLHEYDTKSEELGVFVTNIALSYQLFEEAEKNGTYNGLTAEQLKSKTHWDYNDFIKYLLKTGQVTDPDWIENHLRKEMKKCLVHVTRITQRKFEKKSSQHELYGVDLIIDDQYNLWFIEANQKPLIEGWTPEIVPYFDKLLLDLFEVTFGLLKSRVKRIVNYVNAITRESYSCSATESDGVTLSNLEARREEFRQLSMNYFEPEFEPSASNGFQLIVDENKTGKDRYYGISEECL